MPRPSSLTRRELIALAGVGAGILILGEGVLASEAMSGPASLARAGSSESCDSTEAGVSENPKAAASERSPEGAAASPEEVADSAAKASMSLEDLPWNLRLVNKDHPLDEDFPLPDLEEIIDGYAVDARIRDDLAALLKAARKAGHDPVVCSAFRSHDRQRELYRARVSQSKDEGKRGQEAKDDAAFWVAPPYASEHEAGLAVDLVDGDYQQLDERQEETATQKWLMKHCAKYGFILRYPTDKSAITGIGYEPWHYRYVGKEAASAIAESGLCFEEWIEKYLDQGNA